ncbi:MAG: signal peptidase I [Candidatus Cloacimonetes bacterium]|nr:signal peptidase I [Candidatus Cloacimonadota bacterium]
MREKPVLKQDKGKLEYGVTPIPAGKKFRKHKPVVQDWIEAILFAFVAAMIIRNYTFENFLIPSSSMEKTLLVGDYLVANKLKYYFTDPKQGEIVTFRFPKIEEGTPEHPDSKNDFIKIFHPIYIDKSTSFAKYPLTAFHLTYYARKNVVKRVIGMPGDIVEIKNKIVFVNGKEYTKGFENYGNAIPNPPASPRVVEDFTYAEDQMDFISMSQWYLPYIAYPENDSTMVRKVFNRDWFGPIKVPPGQYFVMGDNRDVSEDSRYWGFLERRFITGTPWMIFWSKGIEFNKLFDEPHIRWNRVFRHPH